MSTKPSRLKSMKATPLPFISRMYFLFTTSPETFAADRPALAAASTNLTDHLSRMTVEQMRPERKTNDSARAAYRISAPRASARPAFDAPVFLPHADFPARKICGGRL